MGKKTSQNKGNKTEESKAATSKPQRKDSGEAEEHEKPHLSLIKNPITTLYYFALVLLEFKVKILKFAVRNIIWISLIVAFFVVPRVIEHPYHNV